MMVTPILAIMSYYLVDLLLREKPAQAIAGQTYKLIAKSNCRFSSGACDLENGNFKSTITISAPNGKQILFLDANKSLQQAVIGFVTSDGEESGPFELNANDVTNKHWSTEFSLQVNAETTMRVALSANDAYYYSETKMDFTTYETSYNRDFRN